MATKYYSISENLKTESFERGIDKESYEIVTFSVKAPHFGQFLSKNIEESLRNSAKSKQKSQLFVKATKTTTQV